MISRYTDILDLNNEGFDISFKMSYQGYETRAFSLCMFCMGTKCTVLRVTFEMLVIFLFFFQRYQNNI